MTIFEQQIDPSQVILEWTTPAAITLIILGGIVLALCSSITLTRLDFLLALTDEDSCFIDGRLLRSL